MHGLEAATMMSFFLFSKLPTGDISWVDIPLQESAETKHRRARAMLITGL
jgi:hypothetical protein